MAMTTALMAVSTAVSVLGTAAGAIGQAQQGKAEAAQLRYQAGIARNNQIIAQRQAADAIERGRVAEGVQRMKTRALIGRQRAALAANNVEVDTGSALALQADTAEFGEVDALTIRANAEREALGFQTQGMNFQAESDLYSIRASNALTASKGAVIGTVLDGIGSVASKWYDYTKLT